MKRILSLMTSVLFMGIVAISQQPAPGVFNYQGVARNSVGNALVNQTITLRLTLHDGSATGPVLYRESRTVTTNPFGLFNVQLGSPGANNVTGTVAGINLGAGAKFIQVEIDPTGGTAFINIGAAQLASVPYSLYSSLANDLVLPFNKTQADAGTLLRINNNGTGISGAIMGVTQSPAGNAWGVHGRVDNTAAGGFSTGVLGTNLSTTGLGIGVTGAQNGSGWGVYGTAPGGIGVYGLTAAGTGVQGTSASGIGGRFTTTSGQALFTTGAVRFQSINESINRILATTDGTGNATWQDPSAVGIVTGSGTVNFVPKWTPTGTNIGNSQISDNGVSIGVNTAAPNASAQLDISSTTKGILIPRMTTAQRTAIASPANSLLVFDNTTNSFWFYNGAAWTEVLSSSTGWGLNGNAGTNPAVHFIGTTDNKDVIFKRNSTRAGLISTDNTSYGLNSHNTASTGLANTAIGVNALSSNTTGFNNTGIGMDALRSNTTGINNTANGASTLGANTTGRENTANGARALSANTTGTGNTANGAITLVANTTGRENTANGAFALAFNTTGNNNVATGYRTLISNTTGEANTANGAEALFSNTIGNSNTANGKEALFSNTTGSLNTANGASALRSNTTGYNNTANGYNALFANTTGILNTANGAFALRSNTTGDNNTANGYKALIDNIIGGDNTANGASALSANTTGNNNTANGSGALFSNTTGNGNTANGANALRASTTGDNNTANGFYALYSNTTGFYNSANGAFALTLNTTGTNNTASGWAALDANTTGVANTANGAEALRANSIGNNNTAGGYFALYANTSGDNNTAIGSAALSNTIGSNNTGIGYGALVPVAVGNNQVRIGNSAVTYAGIQVAWTITSDSRAKTNIKTTELGLDFIKTLNPVSYCRSNDESKKTEYGFLAQEVEEALNQAGATHTGIITKDDAGKYGMRYNDLIAPMVKAIQEQQVIIEQLQKQVEALQGRNITSLPKPTGKN